MNHTGFAKEIPLLKRALRPSGEKHEKGLVALEEYLASVEAIPSRGGKVNTAAVAEACGFNRQVLYKNPRARALVEAAVSEKGLIGIEARTTDAATHRHCAA